jgi:transcriptional regulator with XRE-family HTH domain
MVDVNEALARKARHAFEAARLSSGQVAEACKVSVQAVSLWKRRGKIHHRHFATLARITGFPETWWLDATSALDSPHRRSPMSRLVQRIADKLAERDITPEREAYIMAIIDAIPKVAEVNARRERELEAARRGRPATDFMGMV